jgi:DNA-binding MarR family transcriptional regulator
VLTEKGREAREAAWPKYREAIRKHFGDRMTEGEARQLGAVMKRVLESLEK